MLKFDNVDLYICKCLYLEYLEQSMNICHNNAPLYPFQLRNCMCVYLIEINICRHTIEHRQWVIFLILIILRLNHCKYTTLTRSRHDQLNVFKEIVVSTVLLQNKLFCLTHSFKSNFALYLHEAFVLEQVNTDLTSQVCFIMECKVINKFSKE